MKTQYSQDPSPDPARQTGPRWGTTGGTRLIEQQKLEWQSRPERVDIVLPAGGRIAGDFAREAGAEVKTLIKLEGQTILRRTIHILRATGRIGRIVVVGPPAALREAQACGADAALPEGETGPENIFRGLEWLQGGADHALIAATDLPFLTPEAVNWFLSACPSQADIAVPVVTRLAFETRFPGVTSTYTPLRDGQLTLGCLFLLKPQTLLRNRPHLERIFQARKINWHMARLIGLRTAFRFLTRRLTVPEIAERASRILNCHGVAVPDAPAELAYDIDLPVEYAYARTHLAQLAATEVPESPMAPETAPTKETAR